MSLYFLSPFKMGKSNGFPQACSRRERPIVPWAQHMKGGLPFSCSVMLNEADRMTNSEDPDQKEQSDQGLHCFVSPICPNT